MKTSSLVALMIALVISVAGFAAIDLLFTQAYINAELSHSRSLIELLIGA